ncbi:UvrD-helicase domain-containing protein [uncultured Aquimonas sp.]|uniref:UvrD-helicase domain-containing protein n=1 Tax=uncultured Aquimonas sp. TaxID=385483 RepID=UPI00086CE6D6|nr:UvrD-helicase domain-containing protein [uncultured Aquimonas sp.]ODU46587.1 MAG: Fis family transcriptional regulator [Xanthomonadaceae bacterium SCN 69-123]
MTATDDQFDAEADATIIGCLDLRTPRSFFLYAGAGSGKTRSLVSAVRKTIDGEHGRQLTLTGKKIGVITYTNAACDEIKQRLEFDPRVEVMTIHAFSWSLIEGFNADIRQWVAKNLEDEIAELEELHKKGRPSTKAGIERLRSMESKRRRLARLDSIVKFIYSPTSDNRARDSLNHSEVIAMTAAFLTSKPGLRRMLVSRCPVLLIDESQDTNKALMDAFLHLEEEFQGRFSLGLFGDMMQRIYSDGKERLDKAIPARWAMPRKRMNHRCPSRVVDVINSIRHDVDGEEQVPRSDAEEGVVRVFIAPQADAAPFAIEAAVRQRMATIANDPAWQNSDTVKTLALEHLMSARRFGFVEFFEPLWTIDNLRTSLLQGAGAGLGFFIRDVLPLVKALRANDRFGATAIIKASSPLLDPTALQEAGSNQVAQLGRAKAACDGLLALITEQPEITAQAVLDFVAQSGLFVIPETLAPFVPGDTAVASEDNAGHGDPMRSAEEGEAEDTSSELSAWSKALAAPLSQIERYDLYARGQSQFGTHQGVKGLEFPRVLVVINDDEARGFLFAYDKFFGTKEKSKADLENEAAGRETGPDRTRRLFYVTCSRAEKSLAIVYYSPDPALARNAILQYGWFNEGEVELIN